MTIPIGPGESAKVLSVQLFEWGQKLYALALYEDDTVWYKQLNDLISKWEYLELPERVSTKNE